MINFIWLHVSTRTIVLNKMEYSRLKVNASHATTINKRIRSNGLKMTHSESKHVAIWNLSLYIYIYGWIDCHFLRYLVVRNIEHLCIFNITTNKILFNHLKPIDNYISHHVWYKQICILPIQYIFAFFFVFHGLNNIDSPKQRRPTVFIMETDCVYCLVRNKYLYCTERNLSLWNVNMSFQQNYFVTNTKLLSSNSSLAAPTLQTSFCFCVGFNFVYTG
jgi:hypothetical protein